MTVPVSKRPRVTVVSGYYNRSTSAWTSVQSILEQTFTDFEFLIFDDASSDDTLDVLRSFDDPRIRIIAHDQNVGFVRGMIHAITQARGEFIAVHGSGDVSRPRRLERQVKLLAADPDLGAVGCYRCNVDPSGTVLSVTRPKREALTFEGLLRANAFSHGEVTYRRDLYERVGGYRPQFTFSQDRDLWLRMARHARFDLVPEVLYERTVQPDGVSFVPSKIVRQARFSQLSVELAQIKPEEQARLLDRVDQEGIDAVVPDDHPLLRRRLLKKIVTLAVAGRWSDAEELSNLLPDRSTVDRSVRFVTRALCGIGQRLDPGGDQLAYLARVLTRSGGGVT